VGCGEHGYCTSVGVRIACTLNGWWADGNAQFNCEDGLLLPPAAFAVCRGQAIARDLVAAGMQEGRFTVHAPFLPSHFGSHHTKCFLLEYVHGLRVIIHTANLIYPDCNNKSQAVYCQDFPPKDDQSPVVRGSSVAMPASRHLLLLEKMLLAHLACMQLDPARTPHTAVLRV
jgi:hypothetical protein